MNPQNKIIVNTGDRFGRWTILREAEPRVRFWNGRKATKRMFECLCDCGTIKTIELLGLRSTKSKSTSCGCYNREPRKRIPVNPGVKINRLTILREIPMRNGDRRVLVECDCGKIFENSFLKVRSGVIISCGCYARELNNMPKPERRTENFEYIDSRLYNTWAGMKGRCNNKNDRAFKWYGAKGIKVCDEWSSRFLNFYSWAMNNGYKEDLTIERIDFTKGYEPSNCKWIPLSEQNNNKCTSRFIEYNGVRMTTRDASLIYGIYYHTLIGRLERGWSIKDTIEVPVRVTKKRKNVTSCTR